MENMRNAWTWRRDQSNSASRRKDGWIAFRADEVQALATAHRAQPHLNLDSA